MNMEHNPETAADTPQVKICGLTRVAEATACAALGADAVGCVFFPASPRHVTDDQARAICGALPGHVRSVGGVCRCLFFNDHGQGNPLRPWGRPASRPGITAAGITSCRGRIAGDKGPVDRRLSVTETRCRVSGNGISGGRVSGEIARRQCPGLGLAWRKGHRP